MANTTHGGTDPREVNCEPLKQALADFEAALDGVVDIEADAVGRATEIKTAIAEFIKILDCQKGMSRIRL